MRDRVLVVAPHPDDETLGCGGTLMRLRQQGSELTWLIVTGISEDSGWSAERVRERDAEIARVSELIGFSEVVNLRLPTAQLDTMPMRELIDKFSEAFQSIKPQQVFLPCRLDVHTDHRVTFDAAAACTKWFRNPSVRRVLAYETISETGFGLSSELAFHPNYFVDISDFLDRKLEAVSVYKSEVGDFPFPRSVEAIRALAAYRGAASGFSAAEAFQLLRERH
jgi:LmbE family N-acetylglucosaminyl deacetylase